MGGKEGGINYTRGEEVSDSQGIFSDCIGNLHKGGILRDFLFF